MQTKLGILAGGKDLPKEVIAHCRAIQRPYFVLAFEGQTDPETVENSEHAWVPMGAAGYAIKILKQAGVKEIIMVGPMKRPAWHEIRPDAKGALWLTKLAKNAFGDDSMLRIIINQIENEGFKVVGTQDVMGEALMTPSGVIGSIKPDDSAMKDIQQGLKVLQTLGIADVGQSIIIQDGVVLGVEAAEGTNELIKRCECLHRSGLGGILIKIAKPTQDQRVDLPTIGLETLRRAKAHGLRGLAIGAGSVQLMQRDECINFANTQGLFLYGI